MIQTCRILLSEAVAGRHRRSAAAGWLADAGRSPATDGWPSAPAPLVAAAVPLNPPKGADGQCNRRRAGRGYPVPYACGAPRAWLDSPHGLLSSLAAGAARTCVTGQDADSARQQRGAVQANRRLAEGEFAPTASPKPLHGSGYHGPVTPGAATIETARLTLRPFDVGDFDDLYAYQSRPDVARYLTWEARDRAQARQALEEQCAETTLGAEGKWLTFAVVWREANRVRSEEHTSELQS